MESCLFNVFTSFLTHHRKSFPEGTHYMLTIQTDGAGVVAGIEFLSRLPFLWTTIGWKPLRHYTVKGEVDTQFAVTKGHVKKDVRAGAGESDVHCPMNLLDTLHKATLPRTISSRYYSLLEQLRFCKTSVTICTL